MRVAIIFFGAFLCSAANGEPQSWMQKDNPETLHFSAFISSECPISEAEIEAVINGVLIRSRLRPGEYLSSPETSGSYVKIDCMDRTSELFVFTVSVNFIRYAFGRIVADIYPDYGSFGVGEKSDMADSVRDAVERLVTDYLQANFDLAPE